MKKPTVIFLLTLASAASAVEPTKTAPAPNGVTLPEGYQDWRLIGVSQRTDNDTLRAILGNDTAIRAARDGKSHPWPDGTVLAKLVWKPKTHPQFGAAHVPDQLVHVEVMEKNGARFASTGGWGFGRWLGTDQTPYGKDADFAQECFACHEAVKANDWFFTTPVKLP